MYIVAVLSGDRVLPAKYGPFSPTLEDAENLALCLSAGIGRDTIRIETILGPQEADAIVVSEILGGEVCRYRDGKRFLA